MLHSLPAMLNDLEHKLMAAEDPLPLLTSIRWSEVIDWPKTHEEAARLQRKLEGIQFLINGLQAPLRATLMRLNEGATYVAKGGPNLPPVISLRFQRSV
ncbi:MAG: hypothetical protein P4L36_15415 [Holophaga sp.]|nr:hypothetical protein [Holophaga sp.]